MIHPREPSLGDEERTSFETKGLIREDGDPQSNMEFAHDSLGPSFILFI